jgi:biopolymer transport protein ExbD
LRNPFAAAPFAAVFFLLVIFLLLGALLPTPGLPLQLPEAAGLPGTDQPSEFLAVDRDGRCFYKNQIVTNLANLSRSLRAAVTNSPAPLTLVINADQRVTYGQLVQITLLARGAGITNALLATLPTDGRKPAARP